MNRETACIGEFLAGAKGDETVYITDVRRAFDQVGTLAFHIHVLLYEGETECFPLAIPKWESEEERDFVAEYIRASVFNILCTLGALRIVIYLDKEESGLREIAEGLKEDFQLRLCQYCARRIIRIAQVQDINMLFGKLRHKAIFRVAG